MAKLFAAILFKIGPSEIIKNEKDKSTIYKEELEAIVLLS